MALKLKSFKAEGVSGFGTIEIDEFGHVTTFVGPNGAGKTTLLELLNWALLCLSKGTLRDQITQAKKPWLPVNQVSLVFGVSESSEGISLGALAKHLGEDAAQIQITLVLEGEEFRIASLSCNGKTLYFTAIAGTRTRMSEIEKAKKAAEEDLKKATQGMTPQQREQDINRLRNELSQLQTVNTQMEDMSAPSQSGDARQVRLSRNDVDAILGQLGFPQPVFISARAVPPDKVNDVIDTMLRHAVGGKKSIPHYNSMKDNLEKILQADVDCLQADGKQTLKINGISHNKVSLGTKVTLQYFAMKQMAESNTIVVWDEPENSLHPTRRHRLFALMRRDARQSIIATHATEFTSLHDNKNIIYRCESEYNEIDGQNVLSVHLVSNRREALIMAEQLGIHPSATLFTADVVIWVEGPTDVIFLRHWLTSRLESEQIFEGFHYTFMMYGGSLISHLEACDDSERKKLVNLISVCRHPIILVDSDLEAEPPHGEPLKFLKKGAASLLEEVNNLNQTRPDSACFEWTQGREIENYLPAKALLYAVERLYEYKPEQMDKIKSIPLTVDPFRHYYHVIEDQLVGLGLTLPPNENKAKEPPKAIGRSKWGEDNKVEFMRTALQCPGLKENELECKASEQIERIANFIEGHCAKTR